MGGLAILGTLAGGVAQSYTQAAQHDAEMKAKDLLEQRRMMMGLTGELLGSPNVPAEYKPHLIQYGTEIAHTPFGKKLPSFDKLIQSLPAVQRPQQPPSQLPPTEVSQALPGGGQQTSQILPATTVNMPTPPPFAPAGQFHMYSPEEQQEIGNAGNARQMAALKTQLPNASPEELFNAAQGHAFPSTRPIIAPPGAEVFDPRSGKMIAQNTSSKPLAAGKMKYEPSFGPGGELIGVKDNVNDKLLTTPEEIAGDPEAKKIYDASQKAVDEREEKTEAKESRQLSRQFAIQQQAFINAIQAGAIKDAQKANDDSRKALNKLGDATRQDQQRYQIMLQAKSAADKNADNIGSFDAALLAFHMGMTVGTIKGARTGKDLILMHEKARSLGEDFSVAFDSIRHGALLSPQQRQNFLTLAQEKMQQSKGAYASAEQDYNRAYGEYSALVKGVTHGKTKVAPPSAPPTGVTETGVPIGATATHQDGTQWKFKGGDSSKQENWEQIPK